jgi:uncharacterized LabA/DUF88 family protein
VALGHLWGCFLEPLKTVVFVDGNNFKNNLRAFHFYSNNPRSRYHNRYFALDEKHFDWKQFFDNVIRKYADSTGHEYRLVRVYWYNAASIRPYEPLEVLINSVLEVCRRRYPEITAAQIRTLSEDWYNREKGYFEAAKEVYRHIQNTYGFIEFKYVGEYVVKPFTVYRLERNADNTYLYQGTKEGEKGVDVGITVDMIAKMGYYDVGILVSGDADFIPVVCHLKDSLKYVYQFSIAKGIPPRITYLSPFLRGLVDVFQYFDEVEFLEIVNQHTVPRDILESVGRRLAHLREVTANTPHD